MNYTNWSDKQWEAYETAEVWIPVTVLESLILAAQAHSLGIQPGKHQMELWQCKAKTALALIDKKMEVI